MATKQMSGWEKVFVVLSWLFVLSLLIIFFKEIAMFFVLLLLPGAAYFGPFIILAGIGWICLKIKEIITGKK